MAGSRHDILLGIYWPRSGARIRYDSARFTFFLLSNVLGHPVIGKF